MKCFIFHRGETDIVVQGDFNARTGGIQETISDDDNAFLNVPEDYEADEQYIRQSQDSSTINCRGRSLLETCTALNLSTLATPLTVYPK